VLILESKILDVIDNYECEFLENNYVYLDGYDPIDNYYDEDILSVIEVLWKYDKNLNVEENLENFDERNLKYLVKVIDKYAKNKHAKRHLQASSKILLSKFI
jgi:hypothetical protein